MKDPTLTPAQEKLLELLVEHKDGLTLGEIHQENKKRNLELPADELKGFLRRLSALRYLRPEEPVTPESKWMITHQGLAAIGVIENWPWP